MYYLDSDPVRLLQKRQSLYGRDEIINIQGIKN
jgi:hypothetical protein